MSATQRVYGEDFLGNTVHQVTLTNAQGLRVQLLSYGAIVQSIAVDEGDTGAGNLVLGYDNLGAYLRDQAYLGAVIGRYSNRIRNAQFVLNSGQVGLTRNQHPHHMHGGKRGFNRHNWTVSCLDDSPIPHVEFTRTSPDGEEGYPGAVLCSVTYSLTENNGVSIQYRAETDRPTVINLTNHSYFNLNGDGRGSIKDHTVQIDADQYLPIDASLIPTGECSNVDQTLFDFRAPIPLHQVLCQSTEQINRVGGIDHTFVLRQNGQQELRFAGSLACAASRVRMNIHTTQPGVQCYTGNSLPVAGFTRHAGICFETHHFPDSPNQSHFPPTELLPGDLYQQETVYEFVHG